MSPPIVVLGDRSFCRGFAVSKEWCKGRTLDVPVREVNFEVDGTIVKVTIGVSCEMLVCQDNGISVRRVTPNEG